MTIGIVKGSTVVGVQEEATAATATITVTNNALDAGDVLTINGVAFTEGVDFSAGVDTTATAAAIVTAINASNNFLVNGVLRASNVANVITLTADVKGTTGNSLTLAESDGATNNFTLSGALFTGGAFTEGTAVAPAAAENFIQVLEDGLEVNPQKELVERSILTSSIGSVTPRASTKSVTASLPIECRAGGVEGKIPQYDPVLLSALGSRRRLNNRITTGTGHTTTVITLAAANTKVQIGDFIVILQAGAHHSCFVTAVAAGNFTIAPAAASAPSDNVVLAKTVTYFPANDKHMPYTGNVYWGNEIREQAIGLKTTSAAIENFSTGAIPNFSFSAEGLSFTRTNGSSPFTPSFDAGNPPLALNARIYVDATPFDLNEFSISIENTAAPLNSVASADGRISQRFSERKLSGSFNPYMDDATFANFTLFNNNTTFSLFATFQNPSTVAGEFELGSCVGLYMPKCLITEVPVGDVEGILVDAISFVASTGTAGTDKEIYIGYC